MRTTNILMGLALALTGLTVTVPMAAAECDNYGNQVQAGIGNSYECQVQHCEQGTGVGVAAASASGTQSGKAGAQGSAGTNCTQSSGGSGGDDPPAEETLPEVSLPFA